MNGPRRRTTWARWRYEKCLLKDGLDFLLPPISLGPKRLRKSWSAPSTKAKPGTVRDLRIGKRPKDQHWLRRNK
jgi:hypothetical protein